MNQTFASHFSRPMRALRRAAWVIASLGNPVQWNDPMPARDGAA